MRRARVFGGMVLVLAVIGLALWARFLAGGPVGPFPGGALSGEPSASLPADWSFANREDYLTVESRAFRMPYSRSVWFMAHDGRLHLLLPSFFGDALERRLERDPRVRVRLDGKLYDQVARRVDEGQARGAILAPFLRRQFAIEIAGRVRNVPRPEGDVPVGLSVYRLEDPEGGSDHAEASTPARRSIHQRGAWAIRALRSQ